jgi:hypothetical protein
MGNERELHTHDADVYEEWSCPDQVEGWPPRGPRECSQRGDMHADANAAMGRLGLGTSPCRLVKRTGPNEQMLRIGGE